MQNSMIRSALAFVCLSLCLGLFPAYALVVVPFQHTNSDGIDDTQLILDKINLLDKTGDTLVFSGGVYDISGAAPFSIDAGAYYSNNSIFKFVQYNNLTIQGGNSILLGKHWGSVLEFRECENLTIEDINIHWRDNFAPSSTGKVLSKGSNGTGSYADLDIDFPSTARAGLPADVLFNSNPSLAAPSHPAYNGYFIQNTNGIPTQVISAGTLRVFVDANRIGAINVGHQVTILHKKHGGNIVGFFGSDGITFKNSTLKGGIGLGCFAFNCSDILLDHLSVLPHSGAYVSSNAAASRFLSCRGSMDITDCDFQNSGDDGVNIQTNYYQIREINATRTEVQLVEMPSGSILNINRRPRVNDRCKFSNFANPNDDPHVLSNGNRFVKSTSVVGSGSTAKFYVEFTNTIPGNMDVNDLVINMSATPDSVNITNLNSMANRGRGIILQSRNVDIENCTFANISGPGILLTADADVFFEGPTPQDVTISNCTITNCDIGHSSDGGLLTMVARKGSHLDFSDNEVISNITVDNCTFNAGTNSSVPRNGILLASTDEITLANPAFNGNVQDRIVLDATSSLDVYVNPDQVPSTTSSPSFTVVPTNGVIQAEKYDCGDESYGYMDMTSDNRGTPRNEGSCVPHVYNEVDVFALGSPSQQKIGHISRNEWLTFTVNASQAGNYRFNCWLLDQNGTIKFRIQDQNASDLATVEVTNPHSAPFVASTACIPLSAGTQKIRIWVDVGGFSLDKIGFRLCNTVVAPGPFKSDDPLSEAHDDYLTFSPNPVQDKLHLHGLSAEGTWVHITDALGNVVFNSHVTTSIVDLSRLSAGVYLIQLGNQVPQRMVKQ